MSYSYPFFYSFRKIYMSSTKKICILSDELHCCSRCIYLPFVQSYNAWVTLPLWWWLGVGKAPFSWEQCPFSFSPTYHPLPPYFIYLLCNSQFHSCVKTLSVKMQKYSIHIFLTLQFPVSNHHGQLATSLTKFHS